MRPELKGRLVAVLILIGAVVGFDFLFEATGFSKIRSPLFQGLAFLVFVLLYLLLAVQFTYRIFFDFKSGTAKVIFFIILCMVAAIYLADRTLAVSRLWNYAANLQRRADHFLFKDDIRLGYRGVPNARGHYGYFIGDSIKGEIPVVFDSLGFRTGFESSSPGDSTDLYLGCSFTFGDYITAEQSYPFKTSLKLGHRPLNAALSGYGLAQMVQLADSLIPSGRYRYVFIQMSGWLVDRSVSPNRTTIYGYKAVPYFSMIGDTPSITYPVYSSIFRKKAREWHLGSKNYVQKMLFAATDGFKIEFVDYTRYLVAKAGMLLGLVPKPAKDRGAVEMYAYSHMVELARRHGATPVIVKMSYDVEAAKPIIMGLSDKALIADVDLAVADSCRLSGLTYKERYQLHHPHPGGPIHFDNHPNSEMTELISNVIIHALGRSEPQIPD